MPFGEHMYAFLLGMYLGVVLFSKSICICSVLVDTAKQFFKVVVTKAFLSFLNLLGQERAAELSRWKFGWWCQ